MKIWTRVLRYGVILLAGAAVSACGGGGGGTGGTTPTSTTTSGPYTLGGSVTGLSGTLMLTDSYDVITISGNGSFTFPTKLASGTAYMVAVAMQPTGQTCTVTNGSGVVYSNISNISVSCAASGGTGTASYTVGGSITGLSGSITLLDNSGDPFSTSSNGAFTFTTALAYGQTYNVTVGAQPIGQLCTVTNGSGTITANVTNVGVTCVPMSYTIGVTVTGLSGSTVLQNNGTDNLTVSANGTFTFATAIPANTSYNVTQASQTSTSQHCTLTNATGTATANVTNVALSCVQLTVAPNPSTVTVGNPAFMLTALGSGYVPNSVLTWNGSVMPTSYVSASEVLAQIPASAVSATGTAQVVVSDPGPLAASSPAATVTIAAPSKDATNYQIDAKHSGVIKFNGVALPTAAKWSYTFAYPVSYAITGSGNVYVTTYNSTANTSQLYALSQSTGAVVWGPFQIANRANAVYDNGQVFVLSASIGTSGTLTAYNAATGTQIWTTTLSGQSWFTGAPSVADGYVYVVGAGSGATVYAVDEATSTQTWKAGLMDGQNISPAVTADGVYIAYPCGAIDLRPASGEQVWIFDNGCSGGGGITSVVNYSSSYLDATDTSASNFSGDVLDPETGTKLGTFSADSMAAVDSTVGYYLQGGALNALSLSNNAALWGAGFTGDGKLVSSPIVVDSGASTYVFIGSSAGKLYAVDGATGNQLWSQTLANPIAAGQGWNGTMPFANLSAGAGYLFVPNGTVLTVYQLSTAP